MANEQRASIAHKRIQNARSISKVRTPSVQKKLSKTVEDLAGHQQGFPEGAVKLFRGEILAENSCGCYGVNSGRWWHHG
eukprot:6271441-Ditylum_brightwellii.AAC.1